MLLLQPSTESVLVHTDSRFYSNQTWLQFDDLNLSQNVYLPLLPPNDLKEALPPEPTFTLPEDLIEGALPDACTLGPPDDLTLGPLDDRTEDVPPDDLTLGLLGDLTLWLPEDVIFGAPLEDLTEETLLEERTSGPLFWGLLLALLFWLPAQDVQPSPPRLFSTGRYLFFLAIHSI